MIVEYTTPRQSYSIQPALWRLVIYGKQIIMQNISHDDTRVNGIKHQLDEALAKCARFEKAYRVEKTRRLNLEKQYEQDKKFLREFIGLPNNKVSATTKVAALATLWDIQDRELRPTDMNPVYMPNIADECGLSVDRVTSAHKVMQKAGWIDKRHEYQKKNKKAKHGKSHTSIAFNLSFFEPLDNIEQVEALEESNHGGDRRTPCECGCGEFVKRTIVRGTKQVIVTCKACGTVQSDETFTLDKVTNTDEVAFDASELPTMDDIENMHLDEEVVDIPDEDYIPTYDETLTLFPVEKKPVQGSVPFADMPEGARVALQAVFHRECFSCHDAGRETRWKPVQRDDNSWIAACEYCSTHKGK